MLCILMNCLSINAFVVTKNITLNCWKQPTKPAYNKDSSESIKDNLG